MIAEKVGEDGIDRGGTLYIVATPIGNLEDVTLRAIKILSEVDIILAEDTRVTRKLLAFITTKFPPSPRLRRASKVQNPKLISYHQHSEEGKKLEILNYLLDGKNIALVTDAGTPGISDPGNELINILLSYQPDLKVIPIPGASAIATALSVSGFNVNKFVFLGFLPKKKKGKLIEIVKSTKLPVVFYESPKRIVKTLNFLKEELGGGRRVLVARELTKMHESLYRGTIREVIKKLSDKVIKGEIVVIVEG